MKDTKDGICKTCKKNTDWLDKDGDCKKCGWSKVCDRFFTPQTMDVIYGAVGVSPQSTKEEDILIDSLKEGSKEMIEEEKPSISKRRVARYEDDKR